MMKKFRFTVFHATLMAALCATVLPAFSQVNFIPAPVRPALDENGVDLASLSLRIVTTDLTIGTPGFGGISFGRTLAGGIWSHSYTGAIIESLNLGIVQEYTVSIGEFSEIFSRTSSGYYGTYVSKSGSGATLVELSSTYVYTGSDGSQAVFSKSYTIPGASGLAVISQQSKPNGETLTYHYVTVPHCQQQSCTTTLPKYRLQSISNNFGFIIKIIYKNNSTPIPASGLADWQEVVGARGINARMDYCDPLAGDCPNGSQDWPYVAYTNGALSSVRSPTGGITYYGVNDSDYGPQIQYPGSTTWDVVYSYAAPGSGIVTSVRRGDRTWRYVFSGSGLESVTTVTAPDGGQSVYVFDSFSRVLKSARNAAGETTTYTSDAQGRVVSVTLPSGEIDRYTYDSRGNVTQVIRTGNDGSTLATTAGYDATCASPVTCNKPNWFKDAAGNQTDYTYDSVSGDVTSVALPAVGGVRPTTSFVYSNQRVNTKQSGGLLAPSPINLRLLQSVSTCNKLQSCAGTADQSISSYTYSQTLNLNPTFQYRKDGLLSLSVSTRTVYNYFGQLTTVDGPLPGATDATYYIYDEMHRLKGQIYPDPDGDGPRRAPAARYSYNALGMLATKELGTVDGGYSWQWGTFVAHETQSTTFDSNYRPVRVEYSRSGSVFSVQQFSYDSAGRVVCAVTRLDPLNFYGLPACTAGSSATYGSDRVVYTSYDAVGRKLSVTSGYGTSSQAVLASYSYDSAGRLQSVVDGNGNRSTYSYDGFSRLTKINYPDAVNPGASSATDYEQWSYDVNSNPVSYRNRAGDVFSYPRDALGRITSKLLPGTPSTADVGYSYDLQGRLLSARYSGSSDAGLAMSYDALGRLTSRSVNGRQISYLYDNAGNRTRITHPDGYYVNEARSYTGELLSLTDSTGVVLASYGYDSLGRRVTLARGNGTVSNYGYDPATSRLSSYQDNLAGSAYDSSVGLAYNPVGQITARTQSNDAAYTWSASGADSNITFPVNGRNELLRTSGTQVLNNLYDTRGNQKYFGTGRTFQYDVESHLISSSVSGYMASLKYDPSGTLSSVSDSQGSTDYLYDGDDLIAEYRGGAVVRRYIHGDGADEPVASYEGAGFTLPRYLHADERGSVVAVSDASGAAVGTSKYSVDGASASLASEFGFTGQLWLPSVQLYYFKARMYSPQLGRFMQRDPLGYAAGLNLYAYAGGDPVNARDPSGLTWECMNGNPIWIEPKPTHLPDMPEVMVSATQPRPTCSIPENAFGGITANPANSGSVVNSGQTGGLPGAQQCFRQNSKYVSIAAGAAQGAVTGYLATGGNPLGAVIGGGLGGGVGYFASRIDGDVANQAAGRAELGVASGALRITGNRLVGISGGSVLGSITGGMAGGFAGGATGSPEIGATVGGIVGGANSAVFVNGSIAAGVFRGGVSGMAGALAGSFVRDFGSAILRDLCGL